MLRYWPIATTLGLLLVSGLVHGLWTDRWLTADEPAAAAARLENVPLVLGDWEGEPLEVHQRDLGEVSGTLYRRYVNHRTGAEVSVFLVCGRPGPIAIHTPDVCYSASGYSVGSLTHYTCSTGNGPDADFFTAQFRRSKTTDQTNLRVFWSWNAGGTWQVADNPRFRFFRQPVLYKLYLIHKTSAPSDTFTEDPCTDLMKVLLPELQRTALEGS